MSLNFPYPVDAASAVPFTIAVETSFIDETVAKAASYRPSIDLLDDSNADWLEGPPRANMTDLTEYWTNKYDWDTQQSYINENLSHFFITVPETPNWPHSVPLHFIHSLADDDDALPLLLLHGWPSTSWMWKNVVQPLATPVDDSLERYHIVAPDLPGFGFSPAPGYAGLDPIALAGVLDAFMSQLGYSKYGIISTDLGWWIAMRMAETLPEGRIAGHFCDFFLSAPNATDLERYKNNQTTEAETRLIDSSQAWFNKHTGYQYAQTQQPLALGQALADSPVGFAGWIWRMIYSISDGYSYTFDELITQTLLLFIQGTWGNQRYYKNFFAVSSRVSPNYSLSFSTANMGSQHGAMDFVRTEVPTAMSQWGLAGGPYPELANFNYIVSFAILCAVKRLKADRG